MDKLYSYPKTAYLNRFLPKNKIFEFAKPSSKIRNLFVQQVNKVTVEYSLSSRSLNLPSTPSVPEIQVFKIELKTGDISKDVLRCMDMAIRSPLVFELHYVGKQKIIASFKRSSETDSTKWVISDYYETDWLDENAAHIVLPVALDLGSLYEQLLASLMEHRRRENENMQDYVVRSDLVHVKERELKKIQAKLRKEKQFNRKVAINAELRKVNQDIQQLTDS